MLCVDNREKKTTHTDSIQWRGVWVGNVKYEHSPGGLRGYYSYTRTYMQCDSVYYKNGNATIFFFFPIDQSRARCWSPASGLQYSYHYSHTYISKPNVLTINIIYDRTCRTFNVFFKSGKQKKNHMVLKIWTVRWICGDWHEIPAIQSLALRHGTWGSDSFLLSAFFEPISRELSCTRVRRVGAEHVLKRFLTLMKSALYRNQLIIDFSFIFVKSPLLAVHNDPDRNEWLLRFHYVLSVLPNDEQNWYLDFDTVNLERTNVCKYRTGLTFSATRNSITARCLNSTSGQTIIKNLVRIN